MRRNAEKRLFAKVLLLTAAVLLGVSLATFALLAVFMPRSYTNQISGALRGRAERFVAELVRTPMEESGALFDGFLESPQVSGAELFDAGGRPVAVPSAAREWATDRAAAEEGNGNAVQEEGASAGQEWGGSTAVAQEASVWDGAAPPVSEELIFSFAGSGERYTLVVYGDGEPIAQLRHMFVRMLPALLLMSVFLALIFALFYAALVMRLQNANRRLAADIERERAMERARLDFFSAVSHELKTPVTIVKGQLEGMLLGIGDYRDHEKYLGRALEVTNTLERLVQELLTVVRLETSGADLKRELFDCAACVRGYLEQAGDLIAKKELQITCDMPRTAFVCGNKMLLEKVFSNLIGNAVQYAPAGARIHIAAGVAQGRFEFLVENSGTHIPDECIPKLFEAFYRVEQSRNRRLGGSGLGLYLVQKILALHESRCEVYNTKTGVRFSFAVAEEGHIGQAAASG